jgi:hypothetical protein
MYYHAAPPVKATLTVMPPKGHYEDASKGCPQPLFGDIGAGFPISKVAETSFSKSIAGAVLGAARFCEGRCELDIFSTDNKPDIDISDCPYDFGILEEVRYSKEVPVEHLVRLLITPELQEEIGLCYPEEGPPAEEMLNCVKDGVAAQLNGGKTKIDGIGKQKLENCWLKSVGLTRKEWEMYEHKRERMQSNAPNQYFDLATTGYGYYDDLLRNPKRLNEEGKAGGIVYMSADDYMKATAAAYDRTVEEEMTAGFSLDKKRKYMSKMKGGERFPIPILAYEVTVLEKFGPITERDGVFHAEVLEPERFHILNQEGRHRVLAATELGASKVPVFLVYPTEPIKYKVVSQLVGDVLKTAQPAGERLESRLDFPVPKVKPGQMVEVYYPVTGNIFKAKAVSEPVEKGEDIWKVKIIDKAGDPAYAVWSNKGGGFVYGDVE